MMMTTMTFSDTSIEAPASQWGVLNRDTGSLVERNHSTRQSARDASNFRNDTNEASYIPVRIDLSRA